MQVDKTGFLSLYNMPSGCLGELKGLERAGNGSVAVIVEAVFIYLAKMM
jgi:hypothetical protein